MTSLWKNYYGSICSITFFDEKNERITSGTGFKVKNFLITNNHVIQVNKAVKVIILFVQDDGYSESMRFEYDYGKFKTFIEDGMDEYSWDYAILKIEDDIFKSIQSLEISEELNIEIGKNIAFLGYQFEQKNLSIHHGIISSSFLKNKVPIIQLDSSVNHGNSGGPLIDIKTSKIIGIVTRKATGLTNSFNELIKTFDGTIKFLDSQSGRVLLNDVDPIEHLKITQEQLKKISIEISRSANVGIGYAFSIEKVKESLEYLLEK